MNWTFLRQKVMTNQKEYVFLSNKYIEYENDGDRNKTISIKEYLKLYLKDIQIILKNLRHENSNYQ